MDLISILEQAGVSADEQQIRKFFNQNEESIKKFIFNTWSEYIQKEAPETSETIEVIVNEEESLIEEQDNFNLKEEKAELLVDSEQNIMIYPNSNEQIDKEKAKNDALSALIKGKYIIFPNGKVNQEYYSEFDFEKVFPEITEISFEGLEEIGLHFDKELKHVKGFPNTPGDHKIKMKCKRSDWDESKPVFEREIVIIVNPDPRSLWNNIPTPESIDYYKKDCDTGFIKVESKKTKDVLGVGKKEEARKDMVAASQRGRSHAHEGKPRDDDFSLYFDEKNEWYVMAVADGAGSVQYSREGSRIACQTTIEVCKHQITLHKEKFENCIHVFEKNRSQENRNEAGRVLYDIVGAAAFKAYKEIEKKSLEKGHFMKDYSTTLLLAICKKFEFGWFVGAFWVGDGGIGIYDRDTQYLKILGEPDGGEFAGQTRFLTMPEIIPAEIYKRLRFDIVPDFRALILMTDGVTDPKFETDANLNNIEKWNNLWDDLSKEVDFSDDNELAAGQLLKWLDFWSQGNHDDRTIAILF